MAAKYCALMRQTWFESAKRHLTDMERLAFYEACFVYEFTGEVPTENTCKYGSVLLMFDMVKNDLSNDREKAERIAERNAINGLRGGRPRKSNETPQTDENPEKPSETQRNPEETQSNPIHYTTLHNTTVQQAAEGGGAFDVAFFEEHLWPRLNRSGKFNTRHRACVAKWESYSALKRAAITREVMADLFAGVDNPYFYLEDFAEPAPKWLTGKECEREWSAGRSVFQYFVDGQYRLVSAEDVRTFDLHPVKEMKPA